MFRLLNDVSSYRTAVNSWSRTNLAGGSVASGYAAPDGTLTAWRIMCGSEADPYISHAAITLIDSRYTAGVYLWTDSGQPFYDYQLRIVSNDGAVSFASEAFSISNVPTLYQLSVNSAGQPNLYHRIDGPSNPSSGQYFYAWSPFLARQRQLLTLEPNTDFKDEGEKIESRHRTRDGSEYVYKWGSFERYKFDVEFISSATRHTLNDSFWSSNQNLLFINTPGTIVDAVRVINRRKPIDQFQKPYTDLWMGTIELGTY